MSAPHRPTRLEQLKADLNGAASTLREAQKFASDQVQRQTKAALGRMADAHLLVSGVLGGVLLRTNGMRTEDGPLNQERRVLFASYVVGMPLCELAIEEGRYLQALTLLRQEVETVAQIVASHSGRRKQGKTATVAVLGKDIARINGELSAAAHSANHRMASELLTQVIETEDRVSRGTYFYPILNTKLARNAFALHIVLTIKLINQMAIDYNRVHPGNGFGPVDQEVVNLATDLLKEEGMVEDTTMTSGASLNGAYD